MTKLKLLTVGLSLFSALVFAHTAFAQETPVEANQLRPTPRISTDVKLITLENGESYNLKKTLFKDKNHSTLLAFQVKTQENNIEAVVKTINIKIRKILSLLCRDCRLCFLTIFKKFRQ